MSLPEGAILMPDLCEHHRHELVHQTRYKATDTWQALVIATQIVLFQAATCTDTVHKKLDGDLSRIAELGCLACRLPLRFKQIIRVAKSHDLSQLKALGDLWVKERNATAQEDDA